jgi:endonuclease-3
MVNISMDKVKKLIEFLENRYSPRINKFHSDPFEVLISCVLSQRTRDENTRKASEALFSVANTPEEISKMSLDKLEKLIRPSGPYRQKAKRIKEISKIISERYKGKVPKDREELMELPGVGFKTADIVRCYAYGIPTIPVDTHVNRIPKRLGLVPENVDVEEVRKRLEELVPEEKMFIVNLGLVSFGQEICKPRYPRCPVCPLNDICDYYKNLKSSQKLQKI